MKKSIHVLVSLIILMVMTSVFVSACGSSSLQALKAVEVKNYQGERLDSITDFRENSIHGPQHITISDYKLRLSGLVDKPLTLTYDEVLNNYRNYQKVVTLNCVEGWSARVLWEGILLKDIINDAGLSSNATTVILYAYDGYTTSFPVDYIMTNDIIMAYKLNDVTLPPERGYPFQLVAESKWGYKWIKWITNIELSGNSDYQGYWESRGYSDTGDLEKPFFD